MKQHEYEFNFHKTFVLRYPLWVYVTTTLSVVCMVVGTVLKIA